MTASLSEPFLELFADLRAAGMQLAPDQYDLLRCALDRGFGLSGWDNLRRVCKRLWVKPCASCSEDIFDRVFDRYRERYRGVFDDPAPASDLSEPPPARFELPRIPPRRFPSSDAPEPAERKSPIAAAADRLRPSAQAIRPPQLPLPVDAYAIAWKQLQSAPVPAATATELDLRATIAAIVRTGFFSEVKLRPRRVRRADLLLLLDTRDAMVPFQPAVAPLLDAIAQGYIKPARAYTFQSYPTDLLHPLGGGEPETVARVLSQSSHSATLVAIASDAGAGTRVYDPEVALGWAEFLEQLTPCARDLVWLNPLPPDRWPRTTASAIARSLAGRMVSLAELPQATHRDYSTEYLHLWSLAPNRI